ncbi:TadE/TadG family type IV pilus assembly protein [Bosea sp. OK403]|uniref:TadE/TadG family type IV pilus assembly protein n=1 Tax=Bosea sp. OK403 TaxID=1855286 RepID=UPI000B87534A|nr:TadE/TadG family type IV pilus assembly protein [Bosea sp. OK403]
MRIGSLRRAARSFLSDRSGNVFILFAIALVPILALTGGLIDYTQAANARIQLNAAADSAALAAVSQAAMLKSIADSQADAEKIFDANAAGYKSMVASRTVQITNVGLSRSAKVVYSANYPTQFASFVGQGTVVVSGTSSAAGARAPFIDFYLLLDNSPSMGVAATTSDINVMVAKTSDQCAFACHQMDKPTSDYYTLAKSLGVQMRIDVVRQASQQLMDTAKSTATLTGQYRMATYTMGPSCNGKTLTTIQSITSDLTAAKTSAAAIDLMTIPYAGYNNDQCTDFDATLTSMNAVISNPGDGSSAASPQKVLYFVSDGVADAYNPGGCSQPTTGGRCQEPIDTSFCKTIKDRGIKIAVLYTTYLPLPTNSWYNTWIKPFSATIPTNMQTCASPGLYFEVSPSQGIAEAMNALFQRIVTKAYLSM